MSNQKLSQKQIEKPTIIHMSRTIPAVEVEKLRMCLVAYKMESIYCYDTSESIDVVFRDRFVYQTALDRLVKESRLKVTSYSVTKEGMLEIQFDLKE